MRSTRAIVTALALSLILPAIGRAQALADKIPADALIYIGWKGTSTLGPDYEQSHLKAMVEMSQVRELFGEAIPHIIERIAVLNRMPEPTVKLIQAGMDLSATFARHPTALYFGGIEGANWASIKIALLCDAGDEAAGLSQRVNDLLGPLGVPLHVKTIGSLVVISTFDYPDNVATPLSGADQFQKTLSGMTKSPVLAGYIDFTASMNLVDLFIQKNAPPNVAQRWQGIRDTSGLKGLKHIAFTSGFEGRDWVSQSFVDAPAPRTGWLADSNEAPLADELVQRIPESSVMVGASTFDLGAVYDLIQAVATQFSADGGAEFRAVMLMVDSRLGLNVRNDLLGAFGGQWAFYIDPNSSGNGVLGGTAINRPRNPEALSVALTKLELFINTQVARAANGRFKLEFREASTGGVQMHYLASPFMTPAWAIKDGTFYCGLYPQVVAAALDRAADAKSILTNSAFKQAREKLNAPDKLTAIAFNDLPHTAFDGYQSLMFISRTYLGLGDLFGMQSPPLVLPPLDRILPELEPSCELAWRDDAGWHTRSITPFPGAALLGTSNMAAFGPAQDALLVSILLPSLNKARETANRVKCANNLRQIGLGCILYAGDHRGVYPPDLGALIKTEDITIDVFACPSSGTAPPHGMTPDQAADWVNANSDYVYLPGVKNTSDAGTIVAYEKDNDHTGAGMNMLFADGHVEFMALPEAHAVIERDKKARGL